MSPPSGFKRAYNPLHVYRSLLREASYLPPVCRTRIEPRIRFRFRRHRADPNPEKRLRQALHDFRNLRAANLGDMDRMRKVMMLSFGRIGWRRHELLADLCRLKQPDNSGQLEDQLREAHATAPRDWLGTWDKGKILAFARSQAGRNLRNSPRPNFSSKRLEPRTAVPAMNIWGKPFAEKPARLKEKKWWKQCANRILPPLPRGEWELLKQLATGEAGSHWAVPSRRSSAASAVTSLQDTLPAADGGIETWDWEKYLAGPVRAVERSNSRRFRLASRPFPAPLSSPFDGPAIGYHNYTPRFWRRLYGEIWQLTAVMESKAGGQASGWDITWGGTSLQPLSPTAASLEFFEGVDSKGALPLRSSGEQPKNTT
ncbi:uncharacterized protein SPSK_09470 [Sporothrix schenckii 1099-18]|uniref:LYR motif-containing protein Cup1-like N-terminal domain-containing protein n=1 Tax=Sporothrix schenckii 1099-18 TaxID=1397361 RepID=A0A0F2M5J4_SPOSC|nr:uncharacterized protein SPSK_09470 [Sporothrix schenckii 1099-18]KJR84907.1 hypothetical protein SPSK_09470 [Sporothrix schenckii 1099-18]